jgi:RHS repeat-associated protein
MQAREYLPDIGRFLTQDRYEDATSDLSLQTDPLTQNRYAFVGGNPVTFLDFDGHEPPHGSYVNAPTAFYGESSMSPDARRAQERAERLRATAPPDSGDRNYGGPQLAVAQAWSDATARQSAQAVAAKTAEDNLGSGLEQTWRDVKGQAAWLERSVNVFEFNDYREQSRQNWLAIKQMVDDPGGTFEESTIKPLKECHRTGGIDKAVGCAPGVILGVIGVKGMRGRPVRSRYADGTPVYEGEQPPRIQGPAPEAMGQHSVLRWDRVNTRIYQAREFDADGNPLLDIDFTIPTFPSGMPRPGHTAPEYHEWTINDPRIGPSSGFRRERQGRPDRPGG